LARAEGFALPLAGPKLHLSKQVLKSRFPCKLPQAVFTPNLIGCSNPSSHAKTPAFAGALTWLGRRDSNPRMPGPKPGALPLGHALITD
jgi:hypothetical protein